MSEVQYITTSGRYGFSRETERLDNPVLPALEGDWVYTLAGSAATNGLLFWFWHCEKVAPQAQEIVHQGMQDGEGRVFTDCNPKEPHMWRANEGWTTDPTKVTCAPCLLTKEP